MIKRSVLTWLSVLTSLIVSGCATGTPYQAKGFRGGFSEVQLDENMFRVEFRGNAFTSRQTVETYLLYRCAELTAEQGYDYFVIADAGTDAIPGAYTAPGSYNSTTSGYVTGYGSTAYGSATTRGTYTPGQTFFYNKYGGTALIRLFRGERPAGQAGAFDARKLMQYLAPHIQR